MKLITKEIEKQLSRRPFGSTDGEGENAKVIVKFFGGSSATWLVTEGELENGEWMFFGKATLDGYFWEWGYFSLSELQSLRFRPFGLGVERDMWFSGTVKDGINE